MNFMYHLQISLAVVLWLFGGVNGQKGPVVTSDTAEVNFHCDNSGTLELSQDYGASWSVVATELDWTQVVTYTVNPVTRDTIIRCKCVNLHHVAGFIGNVEYDGVHYGTTSPIDIGKWKVVKPGDQNLTYYPKEYTTWQNGINATMFTDDTFWVWSEQADVKDRMTLRFVFRRIMETTAAPTMDPTPDPTPEPTPEPTPDPTPNPTPEPTPDPTPNPTPEPTPDPTPNPTPDPTPNPTPEPTPGPTPMPTPDPTPEPTPDPTPNPTPEPSPSPTPNPTPEPTPDPTPMPTLEPCDCNELTLLGIDKDSDPTQTCYSYQVSFCLDNIDEIVIGVGESCGVYSESIIQSFYSYATAATAETVVKKKKLEGIKISGLTDGETFSICFDSSFISGKERGYVEYTPARPKRNPPVYTCSTRNLFPICPPTSSPTAEPTPEPTPDPTPNPTPEPSPSPTPNPTPEPSPSPTPEPTPSPTPNPTPEPTPMPTTPDPTPQPTIDPCDCAQTTLLSISNQLTTVETCYKYEVTYCDTDYYDASRSVILGQNNADDVCGRDMTSVVTSLSPPRLTYDVITDGRARSNGIKVNGLTNAGPNVFTICFDATKVYGKMDGGLVTYQDDLGVTNEQCPVTYTLPDFCPAVTYSSAAHAFGGPFGASGGAGKTDPCDCNSLTLLGTPKAAGSTCYKYLVNFCNDNYDTVQLGQGNAKANCGVDIGDVFRNLKTKATGVTYQVGAPFGDDPYARGIEVSGLSDGDEFQICFEGTLDSAVRMEGFVDFLNPRGREELCPVTDTLFDLCPTSSAHAAALSAFAASGGAGKADPCSCNMVTHVGTPFVSGSTCYKYQVNFCNDNYNSIEMGMGNPEGICDTKIKDVFTLFRAKKGESSSATSDSFPSGISYQVGRPFAGDDPYARGLAVDGLSDGDTFTVCFDSAKVSGNRQYEGFVDFLNPRGREEICGFTNTLFDLCPNDSPNNAARKGPGPIITTTTTSPPRTKRPQRTKAPRPATMNPTPSPTESCDCYSTTLIGRQVIGGNKCYKYEVSFCNDGVNSIILGDGNADKECGIADVMDVITNDRMPPGVTYSSYYGDKVRGLKIDGLMDGDRFRICFDKNVVDSTMKYGFIEYQTNGGDVSCKQSDNLPNLCPPKISNAGSGGAGKTDPCSCNTVTLLGTPYSSGESCYRYQVDFCNDNYDTIEMGMGNPGDLCDTQIADVFKEFKIKGSGVTYEVGRPFEGDEHHARGIKIMGLSSGDRFTLCFDRSVYDVRQYGTIDFLNPRGREETCNVKDILFDLCPTNDPPFAGLQGPPGGGRKMPPPPPPGATSPYYPPPLPTTTEATTTSIATTMSRTRTKTRTKTTRSRSRTKTTKTPRTRTTKTPRTKAPRTPMPTTAEPTPEPTPQPTDECECYMTTLIGQQTRGSNKCYRYEVSFCNDGVNSIVLGKSKTRSECGIIDIGDVMTDIDLPLGVGYDTNYVATNKLKGLRIDGLMSGDRFRVCFDKTQVDGTMLGGNIGYITDSDTNVCGVSDTLFDICGSGGSAARARGGNKMPRTTASPTGKAPRNRYKGTPSPTPQPTDECDCVSTSLVGRQVIGNNKCYKYMVDFCNDEINSIVLGDGNADAKCGISDMMDVITNVHHPDGVSYYTTYTDKVSGLRLDGLMSGDQFRVCFDKNEVDDVEAGGYIEYTRSDSSSFSCMQSNTLPELCPSSVSNAASGGSGGSGKTDPCTCNTLTLLNTDDGYAADTSCYQYQVNFCNDNYDTVELGQGNPDGTCDIKIKQVFKILKTKSGPQITYKIGRPWGGDDPYARGISVSGLSDGDIFTICFDGSQYDVRQYGTVDFLNGKGKEVSCPVTDTLFDLCPNDDPPFPAKSVVANVVNNNETKEAPNSNLMSYMWAAAISGLVSMFVMFIIYISCIKPSRNGHGGVYGKVIDNDDDDESDDESEEDEDDQEDLI